MSPPYTVTLRRENPFYALFENGIAPVQSVGPVRVYLHKLGEVDIYMIDFGRVSPELRELIAFALSEVFGSPIEAAKEQIERHGVPIRASEVAVHPAISTRYVL